MSNISNDEEEISQFKGSFQSKLKKLSRNENEDFKYKSEIKSLQDYVSQLSEQNEILVQTIEELESDSNEKISSLEHEIFNSNLLLKEQTDKCEHLQSKIEHYKTQNEHTHSNMQLLEEDATKMGEENIQYQSHINNLESDLDELVSLIKTARTTGKWQFSFLNLQALPIETLLDVENLIEATPRKKMELAMEDHVGELKAQLIARDRTIAALEKDLKLKTQQYHAVIDEVSHTGEMVDSVKHDMRHLEKQQQIDTSAMTSKDSLIQELKTQLQVANDKEIELAEQNDKLKDYITTLKEDNSVLQGAIDLRVLELKNKTQSVGILKRHIKEKNEKILWDSIHENEADATKLQLEEASNKINDLQQQIKQIQMTSEDERDSLTAEVANRHDYASKIRAELSDCQRRHKETVQQMTHQSDVICTLHQKLKLSEEKNKEYELTINRLNEDLLAKREKISNISLNTSSRIESDANFKKEIKRKDREIKLLNVQVTHFENQCNDHTAKVALRDKAIERLQQQQKEYMDEVTRRDSTLHDQELKLLQVQNDKRRAVDELEKCNKTYNLISKELKILKEQHSLIFAENGKLEARIKAFQISNESEHNVLAEEVAKREEYIRELKVEKQNLEDEQRKAVDLVEDSTKHMESLEKQNKELNEQVHSKDKVLIDLEGIIAELKNNNEQYKNKIEEYEDEAREIILKLNAAERGQQEEAHKALLNEEENKELTSEIETLQQEMNNALQQVSAKNLMVEQLANDVMHRKKVSQETEKLNQEQQELVKKLEYDNSELSQKLSRLERNASDDLSSRSQKIIMLQDELDLAHQRYGDVNEELTATEEQVQSVTNKYHEVTETNELLQNQIQAARENIQQLEMDLTLISEKHQTSVKENTSKDSLIINLQSELDATQQEFEHTVEELEMRSVENNLLQTKMVDLQDKCHKLERDGEELAKKIEDNIDHINNLHLTNAEMIKENENLKEQYDSMQSGKELLSKQVDELSVESDKATKDCNQLKESHNKLKFKLTSAGEKNADLTNQVNKEADEKQSVMFKYEDLKEKFEDCKSEKENKMGSLSEKINQLESSLHSEKLKTSNLVGKLKLVEEKLRHSEIQLFEAERMTATLETNKDELEAKVVEQSVIIKDRSTTLENQEKHIADCSNMIKKQSSEISVLKDELSSTQESLDEAKLRNTRCDEIIKEMREKLASKMKECEHQSEVNTKLQLEYKTLEDICHRLQDELLKAENMNIEHSNKILHVCAESDQKQKQLELLENNFNDLQEKLKLVIAEKSKANEKNCVLKQRVKQFEDDVKIFVESNKLKSEQVLLLGENISHVNTELFEKENIVASQNEELHNLEKTIDELHAQLQKTIEEKKSLVSESSKQMNEMNQLRTDLTDTHQQYKETAQQLAHYQEKCTLTDCNLYATQEQLSSRIAEIVKSEKLIRKIQSELKRCNEDKSLREIQVGELSQVIGQTKEDLAATKNKCDALHEENKSQKATLITYESQLDEAHNQTEQLSIDIEDQQNVIKDTENTLFDTQQQLLDTQKELEKQSSKFANMKTQFNALSEKDEALSIKFRESYSTNSQLHAELELCLEKNKSCLEKIASKDAELRVLKSDLHAQQKKCSHYEKQSNRNIEQLEKCQKELKQTKLSSNKAMASIHDHECEVDKLRNELSNSKGNFNETVEQLTLKSKELATFKSELVTIKQQQVQTEQQFSIVDSKNKRLKNELKKSLEKNKILSTEITHLTNNVSSLKTQLQQLTEQQRQGNGELTKREEEIVSLKVDVASTDEKYKLKDDENERLKNEVLKLSQQHHQALEQLHNTRQELESVKLNGDKLTRESELVVENMGTWVKEQRQGNEKIAAKLSKQTDQIKQLQSLNGTLEDENQHLKQQTENLRNNLDNKRSESEKLKKQQSQLAQQQVLVHQLKSRIQEMESTLESERVEKASTVEELHNRIRTNVDTIQQLHKQLSDLNKETLRQRALLDRQSLSRKNLQAQLKSKENDIELLKEDLNKSIGRESPINFRVQRLQNGKQDSVSALLNKELEKAGVSSAEALDKSYWVQRVGELSVQLQQSSDYWAQKLHSLSHQANNSTDYLH